MELPQPEAPVSKRSNSRSGCICFFMEEYFWIFWSAFFLAASLLSFCGVDIIMRDIISHAKLSFRSHIKSTVFECLNYSENFIGPEPSRAMEEPVQRVNSHCVCLHRRYRVVWSVAEKRLVEFETALVLGSGCESRSLGPKTSFITSFLS